MSVHHDSTGIDRVEHIRAIAYSIWEEEGRPEDRAEAHWLRACELVDSADVKAEAILDPNWLKRSDEVQPEPVVNSEEVKPEASPAPLSEALKRLRNAQAA